ncbi:hypothetical protein RGU41_07780 [Cryobacterium sp. 10C3]|nr:hypothetical protein [Cryobacterium sp. 10C3]MDY7556654.1 hypothetical protein [Cryobacterium sp. 10C3]
MMHRAARIEDWMHERRERSARKRGYLPTVIPYAGYGSTEWVRILCRVLLAKPARTKKAVTRRRWRAERREAGIRGWRSFTAVPVHDVTVTIEINGFSHRVSADRGGVVDTVIRLPLTPGWQVARLSTDASAPVDAPLFIVAPLVDRGIISDVDDTVMVTTLPGRCSPPGTRSCSTNTRGCPPPAWPYSWTVSPRRRRGPR